jgi:hypothetical protein
MKNFPINFYQFKNFNLYFIFRNQTSNIILVSCFLPQFSEFSYKLNKQIFRQEWKLFVLPFNRINKLWCVFFFHSIIYQKYMMVEWARIHSWKEKYKFRKKSILNLTSALEKNPHSLRSIEQSILVYLIYQTPINWFLLKTENEIMVYSILFRKIEQCANHYLFIST